MLSTRMRSSDQRLSSVARHLVIPEGLETTEWPTVEAELDRMDWPFDEWQKNAATVAVGLRENGQYAAGFGGGGSFSKELCWCSFRNWMYF